MKRLLPILLLAGISLCSCNSKDIKLNNDIDAKLRAEIKQKNDSLIQALTTSDRDIFVKIASKEFVKSLQARTQHVWRLFRGGYLGKDYKVYDEFEVHGAQQYNAIPLQSGNKGYTFTYSSPAKDSYVSILEYDLGRGDTGAMAVIYGLIDNKWQVSEVEAFNIKRQGKTPPDIYKEALAQEEAGYMIDAAYLANYAASTVDNYENSNFKFTDEKKIKLFAKTLENKMAEEYTFPFVMEGIPTKPAFTKIYAEPQQNAMRVIIGYETSVDINNVAALDKEFEKVRRETLKHFALNYKKDNVTLEAYNRDKEARGEYTTHTYKLK